MTDATLARQTTPPRQRRDHIDARVRPLVVRALVGNLALLSGIVTMPIVIAVGYFVRGHR